MSLRFSKGYYIIFSILAIATAVVVFLGTSRIVQQEKEARMLHLERANRVAATELKEALSTYATLLSGIKSFVGTNNVPNKNELKGFLDSQLKDLEMDAPFSVAYIDTSHIFVYDIVFEYQDKDYLKGRSMESIIGVKGIQRMDTLMRRAEFYASNPTNLLEGKVGLPLGFGVLDSTGRSQGYITSVALFAPIVNRVYEIVDKENIVLSFQSVNGNYFDRAKSYNDQKDYSTTPDPEYFQNFQVPQEEFLYSDVNFYNNIFTVGTAYKQPYAYSTPMFIASTFWYFAVLGFMLFLITRYYIYKRKNKTIAAQKQRLSELIATKNKFFSIIAHDLRSPLSSVINFLDILKEEKFQNLQTNQIIESLEDSSRNSISLLDNLLKWSKVQTGQIKFEPEALDVLAITKDQIQVQQHLLDAKNLNVRVESSFKKTVHGDKNMVATIIRNLLSNAIKFSHPNDIVLIELSKVDKMLSISIEDSGIGIPQSQLKALLDLTKMTTQSGTLNEQGSGLGLILCEQFLKAHNGKLIIESEEGNGTIITCLLPL